MRKLIGAVSLLTLGGCVNSIPTPTLESEIRSEIQGCNERGVLVAGSSRFTGIQSDAHQLACEVSEDRSASIEEFVSQLEAARMDYTDVRSAYNEILRYQIDAYNLQIDVDQKFCVELETLSNKLDLEMDSLRNVQQRAEEGFVDWAIEAVRGFAPEELRQLIELAPTAQNRARQLEAEEWTRGFSAARDNCES